MVDRNMEWFTPEFFMNEFVPSRPSVELFWTLEDSTKLLCTNCKAGIADGLDTVVVTDHDYCVRCSQGQSDALYTEFGGRIAYYRCAAADLLIAIEENSAYRKLKISPAAGGVCVGNWKVPRGHVSIQGSESLWMCPLLPDAMVLNGRAAQFYPEITYRVGTPGIDMGDFQDKLIVTYWADPGNVVLAGWLRHIYGEGKMGDFPGVQKRGDPRLR